MKWILRAAALLLALDLTGGLLGVAVALRSGGASAASQPGFWTPEAVAMTAALAAGLGSWLWFAVRAVRSPWSAAPVLVVYLCIRFVIGGLAFSALPDGDFVTLLAMNAFPFGGLLVAILALVKPPPEPGGTAPPGP